MATPAPEKIIDEETQELINDTKIEPSPGTFGMKKNSSLQHITIRSGVSIYRFTDKRGPLQRFEADKLLTNHKKALDKIAERQKPRNGKQFMRAGQPEKLHEQIAFNKRRAAKFK